MTYPEAIQFLYGLRLFGANFGLATTRNLAAQAGNPQSKLRFIHVAGTNGKGSTCAMLENIYRAAGLRVGLFTSPHLVSFRERLQVNREMISEGDVVRLVQEVHELGEAPAPFSGPATDGESPGPTFFEFVTIMALRYFAEQKCDLVIWETGLGGRLDATNIVTPLVSVITNIGIEHSEWLGDTHEKIAMEKAGIIKPGVPVITGARMGQGLEVIAAVAREKQAALTVVDAAHAYRPPLDTLELALHGPYQRLNAATAAAVVRALRTEIPVTDETLRYGLSTAHWAGRMQTIKTNPAQIVVLDAAHNPAGAEALRIALEAEFPGAKPTLIFGVFRDKDSASMCHSLAPLASRLLLTPVHSERSEDPAKLLAACREANPQAAIETCASLEEALKRAAHEKLLVIAGSLYLIGEAMELLHLAAMPTKDEKGLNEWKARERPK